MAEIMVKFDDLRRYCENRHCGSVPLEYIKQMQTIEAEPVRHSRTMTNADRIRLNKDQLIEITNFLKENVWRNDRVMYCMDDDTKTDLIDIVTTLHNLLYESITGEPYDYAFHWANKIGCCVDDKYFNELIGREKKNESM